jgi:hypothetical protein
MADATHIEWTDASECGRPLGRRVADIGKRKLLEERRLRLAPCLRQPPPDVFGMLAAVAGTAGRDDVCWLRQSALRNSNNMIPGRCRVGAVGALPVEGLRQQSGRLERQRVNTPSATGRPLLAAPPELIIRCIAPPLGSVEVISATTLANVTRREPASAISTPREATFGLGAPFRNRRTRSLPLRSTTCRTNVAATVEATDIHRESVERPHKPASGTALFTSRTSRHIPAVRLSSVLRSHPQSLARNCQLHDGYPPTHSSPLGGGGPSPQAMVEGVTHPASNGAPDHG